MSLDYLVDCDEDCERIKLEKKKVAIVYSHGFTKSIIYLLRNWLFRIFQLYDVAKRTGNSRKGTAAKNIRAGNL